MLRMGSSYEPHGLFRGHRAGLTPGHDGRPDDIRIVGDGIDSAGDADNEEDEDRGRWG